MKKSILIVLASAALIMTFILPNLHAVEAPGEIILKTPEGVQATQSPVAFSHEAHSELECADCHHKLDENPDNYGCTSAGCHDDFESKRGDHSAYAAFHNFRSEHSCLGCHRAKAKAGESTGPARCPDCHPQE